MNIKKLKTLSGTVFTIALLNANILHAKDVQLADFKNLKYVQENSLELSSFHNNGDLYIVKASKKTPQGMRTMFFTVSKDLKYTFVGRTIENSTNEDVYIPSNLDKYKQFASFTHGEGSAEYFLFTDPECPYCKEFEKNLAKSALFGKVKIHYYLYPLPFHKEARPMSYAILDNNSSQSKFEYAEKIMLNNQTDYKTKTYTDAQIAEFDKQLENIKKMTLEFGVNGTPTLLSIDGRKINIQNFLQKIQK